MPEDRGSLDSYLALILDLAGKLFDLGHDPVKLLTLSVEAASWNHARLKKLGLEGILAHDPTSLAVPEVLEQVIQDIKASMLPDSWVRATDDGGYMEFCLSEDAKCPPGLFGRDGIFHTQSLPPAVSLPPSSPEEIERRRPRAPWPHEMLGIDPTIGFAPPFGERPSIKVVSWETDPEDFPLGGTLPPARPEQTYEILRPFLAYMEKQRREARERLNRLAFTLSHCRAHATLSESAATAMRWRVKNRFEFLRQEARLSKMEAYERLSSEFRLSERQVRRVLDMVPEGDVQ